MRSATAIASTHKAAREFCEKILTGAQKLDDPEFLQSTDGFGDSFFDPKFVLGEFRQTILKPIVEDGVRVEGHRRFLEGWDWAELDSLQARHRQLDEILSNLDSLLVRAHAHAPALPAKFGRNTLIKAYLRLGGYVGEGAFVDHAFNTTDVCLILDTARMSDKHREFWIRKKGARG